MDLAVPSDAPVADLLADVVALAGEPVARDALPRWALCTVQSGDLAAGATLESAGVVDGAVLYLRRLDEPVVGLHGFDLVEQASAGGAGGLAAGADRIVLSVVAAALLVLLAWLLLVDGTVTAATTAAVLAVAALVGGRWLQTRGPDGTDTASAVLALMAAPLLGVAVAIAFGAAALTAPTQTRAIAESGGPGGLAAALAGAATGALLAAAIVRAARIAGAAGAALLAAAALTVALSLPLTEPQAAGIAAVAAVLVVGVLPRLMLRIGGLRLSGADRADGTSAAQLDLSRRAMPWALGATGLLLVLACAVLALAPPGAELALAGVCGLLMVLRSRRGRDTTDVLLLAVAGYLALILAGAGLALSYPRTAGPLAVLVASAAVLVLAGSLPDSAVDRPRWTQRRRRLEAVALVAVVPLLAAVLGAFGVVVELARGAE